MKKPAAAAAVLLACCLFASCMLPVYRTRDIEQYGNYSGHIEREAEELFTFRTQLAIFPQEIKDSYVVNDFYYYCSSLSLDNMYQILLDYTLPEAEFEAEAARIAGLDYMPDAFGRTSQITRAPIYDDTTFPYPAYITVWWAKVNLYEYALIDRENCRIICIYSSYKIQKLPADASLIPQQDTHPEHDERGYTIYSLP